MTRGFAQTRLALGAAVAGIVIGIAASSGFLAIQSVTAQERGRGAAQPPQPCGPKANLPENLSANVDPKSRCFELRMYTVDQSRVGTGNFKGGINELHQRFREKEVELFVKHGAQIVGVWQHMGNPDTLVWMLAYRDRAHRDDVWAKFGADPDWKALMSKYMVPLSANTFMMSASDYSPMK
jgi:hypothetical protein